ncbi:hypothetical protein [Aequorivita flava]|uniref:Lipoprotein n=1 Tax=Aequorivita flava TaxID=3114371 RepID=A0AB35YZM8_9FLAO
MKYISLLMLVLFLFACNTRDEGLKSVGFWLSEDVKNKGNYIQIIKAGEGMFLVKYYIDQRSGSTYGSDFYTFNKGCFSEGFDFFCETEDNNLITEHGEVFVKYDKEYFFYDNKGYPLESLVKKYGDLTKDKIDELGIKIYGK